jgi:hypothetical protein
MCYGFWTLTSVSGLCSGTTLDYQILIIDLSLLSIMSAGESTSSKRSELTTKTVFGISAVKLLIALRH